MLRHSPSDLHRAQSARATIQGAFAHLGRVLLGTVIVLVAVTTELAAAQGFRLRETSGAPVNFPIPTEANYDAGFVLEPTPVAFDVDARTAPNTLRRSTVSIRSTAATMGGSKPIADLEWRRVTPLGAWTSMTTVNAVVDSKNIQRNGVNDPWANSIEFRVLLDWADDPPGTYAPGLVLTLTIAAP